MTALVDTNVLVYRYDARFPEKQAVASRLLRDGLVHDELVLPHQALIEFLAATTRTIGAHQILEPSVARRETEEHLRMYPIVYPTAQLVRTALMGMAHHQLRWFDAHLWAYAEHYGLETIYTEDFQDGRYYGSVRVINPFASDSRS